MRRARFLFLSVSHSVPSFKSNLVGATARQGRPTDYVIISVMPYIHTNTHTQSQSQSFHAEYLRDLSTLPTLVGTLSEISTYAVHIFMMTLKHNNSSHLRHFQSR